MGFIWDILGYILRSFLLFFFEGPLELVVYSCSRGILVRPPTRSQMAVKPPTLKLQAVCNVVLKPDQLTISLNFFIGSARTVLDAGFALKTQGSLVKGFTPFLAGDAGFFFSFKFNAPASLNEPADFK